MFGILWGVVVVLFVLWLLGFIFHVAGGLIHLLLVIAAIVLIYNIIAGSRSRGTLYQHSLLVESASIIGKDYACAYFLSKIK